jgi:hypothetical protein
MVDSVNVGLGAQGLDESPQMQEDLLGILDRTRQPAMEANAQQNLRIAQGKAEGEMKSLNDRAADTLLQHLHRKQLKDLNPETDREEYMKALGDHIKKMEAEAKNVDISGTGNISAKNTFLQVAQILKQRLHAMQSEAAGITTQPAGGQ